MKALKLFLAIALIGFFATACNNSSEAEATEETTEAAAEAGAEAAAEATPEAPAEEVTNEYLQNPTTMAFGESEHNFGDIKQGETVEHVFTFTNTGENPLLISNAQGSCGCTVPSYPTEPIPPGESGEILVKFDSKGKTGDQHKTVTITANTDPAQTRLAIKGNVIAPEGGEAATPEG